MAAHVYGEMESTITESAQPYRGALATPEVRVEYRRILEEDGHDRFDAFIHGAEWYFGGIDLRGKSVLEIGSGRGLMTLYAAMAGAQVLSMEPELDGSTSGMIALQRSRLQKLGLTNVEFVTADFNTWEPAGRRFDIVLSCQSINHIQESPHHALSDPATYDRYVTVARNIRRVVEPGGVTLVSDACRYGFFMWAKTVGIRRPWHWKQTRVNWRVHQNPAVWRKIFLHGGFSGVDIRYPVPYPLRTIAPLIENPVANFFLKAGFLLRGHV